MPSSPEQSPSRSCESNGATQAGLKSRCRQLLTATPLRVGVQFGLWFALLWVAADTATAANGLTLSKGSRDPLAVPQWLYLATGSATIGASALLASFMTDRAFIRAVDEWSLSATSLDGWMRLAGRAGRIVGVVSLFFAVYIGFSGPELPTASFTILVVFAGIRAGLPIVAYVTGNVWPALNPWRAIASVLPTGFRDYPGSWKRWPAVAGLLALVWAEIIFPVSTVPSVLATGIVLYSTITLLGALAFGSDTWFRNADPISVLFRFYGAVGPLSRSDGGLTLSLPGSNLSASSENPVSDTSDVAFIIALVWELTYSGFITTSAGVTTVRTFVNATSLVLRTDTRAIVVYSVLLLAGYAVFFGAYWYAGTFARRRTETYLTPETFALHFGAPLLAIAAGYHFAHYVGLFMSLSPALLMAVLSPFSPPANPLVLSIPGWFSGVSIASVLLGHLLAIWWTHSVSYDLFASKLVAIRSQYPFIAVMIAYTVVSLWILSLPSGTPPFLP